ncbi:hypothetical protein [Nocardioides sp. B-3]|uniref:hypothetical protein n=1 Tax=Nocardioides sp. B-3 TaxID=2895565 RepID=UPI002152769B|nr:hypothetical protein [Nocardioides sp. B-3]UUZ61139.1 hypothetical protein LP418_11250 [Nocardioides sp. B-3]
MLRLEVRDREGAEGQRGPGRHHRDLLRTETATSSHVGARLTADQHRAGAASHDGRVHDVVEVRVHRHDGCQPPTGRTETQPAERAVDATEVRRDRTQQQPGQGRPGEEAVRHDRRLAVIEQEGGDAEEGHPEVGLGLGGVGTDRRTTSTRADRA